MEEHIIEIHSDVINSEINEDELIKLIKNDQTLNKYLYNNLIRRKIYIKNKLINLII